MSDQRRPPQYGLAMSLQDWHMLDRIYSTSPAAFETLLRPDRDSGLLTDSDYKSLQTEMFWINRAMRRYRAPMCLFLGANAGWFAYVRRDKWFRAVQPRWRWVPSIAAGGFGLLFAAVDGFATEYSFQRRLQNPTSVHSCMRNVRSRLSQPISSPGSDVNWDKPSDDLSEMTASLASSPFSREQPNSDESESPFVRSYDASPPTPNLPGRQTTSASSSSLPNSPTPTPKSRWDEIRAANSARSAIKASSWDVLREHQERERVNARNSGSDALSSSSSGQWSSTRDAAGAQDRAEEQNRFDAMLDAERKRASS
ncbi:hypothetical protein EIP91_008443 [Steccherinum ochraceum]|uniref:Uncharacterized protein n=1 Tax=Steccherinum ochraceum TaxID=92696 RepID=A0A4R0RB11_9APHY|nr:hypothetical protein EIP91_008443 [Steccherinum ochraceum]